ncbi:uncharacterized protein LOC115575815 isoform X1 [Sparus aurata]|uniref:uncharacterized protein LOC115575815 isoform X1 n=1 Tax=Sparus aurata TaxID=8175 RepID=UPI0011C13B57|nr:uncharacterized protein LOC115575815 isoform X1 [Sparus aurata]
MTRPLEDLAEVRRIIESSDRSDEENQRLMVYIINKCPNAEIKESLKENFQSLVILPLVDMYRCLVEEFNKKEKLDKDFDIIFVAHGEIDSFMFSANYLMPLPSIRDVVLYSPWNCAINADVAYGVATGSIQPHHRVFFRIPQQGCPVPDYVDPPDKLPNDWNSMSEAGGSRIPRILLSPLKDPNQKPEVPGEKPGDPAWNHVVFLQDRLGEPGRNRVLIPFTHQPWTDFAKKIQFFDKTGSFDKIPFWIVTLVLSVVLEVCGYRATVHLAACLDRSEEEFLNEAELQYGYTIDNTMMGSSEERIQSENRKPKVHDAMYKFFKDMFG